MRYRASDYASVTYDLIVKNPNQRVKIARSFWGLLVKRKQTKIWRKVIDNVKVLENRQHPTVVLETPFSLSSELKCQIIKLCRQSIGLDVKEVQEIIRPELIGGVVGTTLTHQFDWSISKLLNKLI